MLQVVTEINEASSYKNKIYRFASILLKLVRAWGEQNLWQQSLSSFELSNSLSMVHGLGFAGPRITNKSPADAIVSSPHIIDNASTGAQNRAEDTTSVFSLEAAMSSIGANMGVDSGGQSADSTANGLSIPPGRVDSNETSDFMSFLVFSDNMDINGASSFGNT